VNAPKLAFGKRVLRLFYTNFRFQGVNLETRFSVMTASIIESFCHFFWLSSEKEGVAETLEVLNQRGKEKRNYLAVTATRFSSFFNEAFKFDV
jgi:hypothetical protein